MQRGTPANRVLLNKKGHSGALRMGGAMFKGCVQQEISEGDTTGSSWLTAVLQTQEQNDKSTTTVGNGVISPTIFCTTTKGSPWYTAPGRFYPFKLDYVQQ